MTTNLSANREIRNYEKEDAFNFLIKADAIRYFLEDNVNSLLDNKMLALYGNWGSGKTSLMRHIEREINRGIYFPIFFEAWEHEHDDNLALSLCDALTANIPGKASDTVKSFRKTAMAVLKGFGSGINVKFSDPISKSLEFSFDGKNAVEAFDKAMDKKAKSSFFAENQEFKKQFREIEELIIKNSNATRIIVFVDDLDRCEPDNVLNLITALKLFFTYGEKTIFLAGLDKEAVTKAVVTKYQDVIKSEEYLEKVFDISFSMPKTFSLEKYLKPYFGDDVKRIEEFFTSIGFINPRHIKKVINKYEILNTFKVSASIPPEIRAYIPELIFKNERNKGNLWETIFCLYFIILYESFPDQFSELEHYQTKLFGLVKPLIETKIATGGKSNPASALSDIQEAVLIENLESMGIRDLLNSKPSSSQMFAKFVMIFSHGRPDGFMLLWDDDLHQYDGIYKDNGILTRFCRFLILHQKEIQQSSYSDYIFWNYFNMSKYLL